MAAAHRSAARRDGGSPCDGSSLELEQLRDFIPEARLEHLDDWRELTELLLTQKGGLRTNARAVGEPAR